MEKVNCFLCNQKHDIFIKENGYEGHKCPDCELLYISPRPNEQEMIDLYNKGEIKENSAQEHMVYNFGEELMARHIVNIIKKFKPKGNLLEIGPGGGEFIKVAKERGFHPYAIEINTELADYISKQFAIPVENSPATNADFFPSKEFDVIVHKDVLSHLHHPQKVFETFQKKLAKDGLMVFETGNMAGVHKRSWIEFADGLGYPGHLYLFSSRSVKKLLEATGFELVRSYSHSIVLYRLIYKFLGANTGDNSSSSNNATKSSNTHISLMSKLKGHITFILVYILGRILPKNWPATVIYVAKKKANN